MQDRRSCTHIWLVAEGVGRSKGMIDEIRLSEKSKWLVEPTEGEYGKGWNDCNKHWIEVIKEMPKVGEWIPCSERLPEYTGCYLTTTAIPSMGKTSYLIKYVVMKVDKAGKKRWYRQGRGNEVIAWMPLPEPYKEGAET